MDLAKNLCLNFWWLREEKTLSALPFITIVTLHGKAGDFTLKDLVVRESERSKGIGKLLFNATMKQALADNCTGMMWQVLHWNEKAIAFYEKYGSHFDKEFVNCNLEADQMKSFIS